MRSLARESVFQYIFSRLFNPSDEGLFSVLCKELNSEDKKFAADLLSAIDSNEEKYLNKIEELSNGYALNRLHRADKCALIIGMAELDNFDTPPFVVVDEAVNLVAKFSTESSTNFVNGILAECIKEK